MKVIKVDSSNDQGADFQPINLKEVFRELKASVEGSAGMFDFEKRELLTRDKKDIVKEFESLQIIG
mgnify:CR=1 FL=1